MAANFAKVKIGILDVFKAKAPIYWPDSTERSEIVRESFKRVNYFSRYHIYALKAQVVCDYQRKILPVMWLLVTEVLFTIQKC